MIETGPLQNGTMDVRVKSSGKLLGAFYMEVDGYFYFHPFEDNSGVWSSEALIGIGKELAKINEDYDKKVTEEFNQVVEEEHQGNRIDNLFDFTDFSSDNYIDQTFNTKVGVTPTEIIIRHIETQEEHIFSNEDDFFNFLLENDSQGKGLYALVKIDYGNGVCNLYETVSQQPVIFYN